MGLLGLFVEEKEWFLCSYAIL